MPRRAALRGALLFLSFAGTFLGAVFAFALILEPYANAQPEPQVVAAPAPAGVWYYCDSTMSYYPHVLECKEGWRTEPAIPPTAPPPAY